MTATLANIDQQFRTILAPDSPGAHACRRHPQPTAKLILEPATEQQLAAALRIANDGNLAVSRAVAQNKPGHPPARADNPSTKRLDRILGHVWSDMTVSVEAGCTVACSKPWRNTASAWLRSYRPQHRHHRRHPSPRPAHFRVRPPATW
jgi:hypothetical protein